MVSSACISLAGADRAAERQQVEAWAREQSLTRRLRVTNDAEPILAAVSPEGWGVALISGTGSFAFGRNETGASARCGGWGYLLGDEGSAYAIALAGLRAVAQAADGRGESTVLQQRVPRLLGVDTAQALISVVYRPEFSRREVAQLAPLVFEAARESDPVAQRIIAQAAGELADLVRTLARRLGLTSGSYPLAAAGGVLIHHGELREAVVDALSRTGSAPAQCVLVAEPVRGAIALARQLLLE
jgi:N-acetylglucosamine kinase-like BadF-type ATPase